MWAYRKSYGFLELILSELLNVLYFFATFYLHFFLFLGQMGRAGQKNKRIIKTYVFAMFSEILGSCPAHSFFYFFKKNQKNVKLTTAHQYWGAPQCNVSVHIVTNERFVLNKLWCFLHLIGKCFWMLCNIVGQKVIFPRPPQVYCGWSRGRLSKKYHNVVFSFGFVECSSLKIDSFKFSK